MLSGDKPIIDPMITDAQKAVTQVFIDKWVKANKMCILIIKCCIDSIIFGGITEKENAKDLLESSISLRDLSSVGNIVEFIGTFRQVLNSGHILDLEKIFYVPSLRLTLIYVPE